MREYIHAKLHKSEATDKEQNSRLSYASLKQELNLTPSQCEQLKTILDDFVTYNHEIQTQFDDVRATGKNKIMRILDPTQRARFEQLYTRVLR